MLFQQCVFGGLAGLSGVGGHFVILLHCWGLRLYHDRVSHVDEQQVSRLDRERVIVNTPNSCLSVASMLQDSIN